MPDGKLERWSGPADIAWCDEHGLHGARDECFDCGKPVEQIRMLPLDELLERIQGELRGCAEHGWLAGSLGDAIAAAAGKAMLDCVTPEQLALGICNWLKDFGPREDEDGEGVKPADPSDGAAESIHTGVDQKSAPHAGEQEGAESSRVGGPSDDNYSLLVAFDSDDPEFVRGVEAGRLWEMLKSGDEIEQMIHASNSEMAIRICEAQGRSFSAEDVDAVWTVLRVVASG